VDALGGEFGADAAVSATSVHFEVIKRSLDRFADLGATILARPTFDPRELSRLLREAEAELIEGRDSDRSLCSRAFRRTLFAGHPYGRRSSGTIATLRSITRDDAAAFYARHYTRRNAVVAVSGDIAPDEARALADRLLAGLPEGEPIPDPVPPPARRPGRRLVFVDKPDRTQTQMVIGGLGTDARDPDHVPLMVANTAFGGTFSSRLMQEVRAKRGWSYGAYSRVGFDRQRDAFTMWTAPAAADAAACLSLQLELLHAFREGGVTADELQFVKRYLVRSHAFEIDTARKRVHQRLEEVLFDLPQGYHDRYLERVEAVTTEAAGAAVRERIAEDDLVVGVVGTHTEIGKAIAGAIPDLREVEVVPFDFE
jgi:zinc protease